MREDALVRLASHSNTRSGPPCTTALASACRANGGVLGCRVETASLSTVVPPVGKDWPPTRRMPAKTRPSEHQQRSPRNHEHGRLDTGATAMSCCMEVQQLARMSRD